MEADMTEVKKDSLPAHSVHMRMPALCAFIKLAIMEGWDDETAEQYVKQMGQLTFWNNGEPLTQQGINDIMEEVKEKRVVKRRSKFTVIDGGDGLDITDQ
jgi:hypothetical protein